MRSCFSSCSRRMVGSVNGDTQARASPYAVLVPPLRGWGEGGGRRFRPQSRGHTVLGCAAFQAPRVRASSYSSLLPSSW
jgi:hypothetical protein